MKLPTVINTIARTGVGNGLKLKWDIIHTSLLMLHCDDEPVESTATSILQCFLYFHQKLLSKDEVTKVCLHALLHNKYN